MDQSRIDQIKSYDNFFDRSDFIKILEKVSEAKWEFGHSSYSREDPRYRICHQFWKIEFNEDKFFTDYLLNIIQEKTNQSYICEHVYANGQTYGLDGTLHQDCYDDKRRTFLLYANVDWRTEWGGATQFYLEENELYSICPKPNKAVIFPGIIYHSSAPTSRLFNGLRVTVAWKLKNP